MHVGSLQFSESNAILQTLAAGSPANFRAKFHLSGVLFFSCMSAPEHFEGELLQPECCQVHNDAIFDGI
jgi:hypothetical protein